MRYLVLVSHGTFAPGLHSVLDMLVGKRDDILSTSLEDGMGADVYVQNLKDKIKVIGPDDSVFLFGDIIGGSPLTNAINVITEAGLLPHAHIFGGMNLPMAMTVAFGDEMSDDELAASVVEEGRGALQEFVVELGDDDDEEDL